MEVFHFVANELKNVPLFESEMMENGTEKANIGAIYNDFDRESPFVELETPSIEPRSPEHVEESDVISQKELDKTLLDADKEYGIFNQDTYFEFGDTVTETPDEEHYTKVKLNLFLIHLLPYNRILKFCF